MLPARGCFGVFTKYLGPTNHRGGRVKATAPSGRSITVPWDHALDVGQNHEAAARALCGLLCRGEADAKGPCLRVLTPDSSADYAVWVFPDASAPWRAFEGPVTP